MRHATLAMVKHDGGVQNASRHSSHLSPAFLAL